MANVADLLVRILQESGVRRHEEVPAFAAGGDVHLTNCLAVCALTYGLPENERPAPAPWFLCPRLHGHALQQASGAQATFPGCQVIAFRGDGGFAMQKKLPVKIIVFNNGVLGFVETEMKASGFLDTGVDLINPDFARLAGVAGLFERGIAYPEDLLEALRPMMLHDGPALLDVVPDRQEPAMPPKTQPGRVVGFGLWLTKAVVNGRGDQVIDLACANLLH
jgi:thiamine pyrophosphate-dependent acetolactate synthase large subunit-like protein